MGRTSTQIREFGKLGGKSFGIDSFDKRLVKQAGANVNGRLGTKQELCVLG